MTADEDWERAQPRSRRAGYLALLGTIALAGGLLVAKATGPAPPEPEALRVEEVVDVAPTPRSTVVRPLRSGREWHMPAGGPLESRGGAVKVWTGERLMVWGGVGERPYADGALYELDTGRWRRAAVSGLEPRSGAAGVWSGTEVIVAGGDLYSKDAPYPARTAAARDGAAYDPVTDSWRPLPPLPFSTSAGKLFVNGGRLYAVSRTARRSPLAVLDAGSSMWRLAPPPPGWRPGGDITAAQRGDELLLRRVGSREVLALDLPRERWARVGQGEDGL